MPIGGVWFDVKANKILHRRKPIHPSVYIGYPRESHRKYSIKQYSGRQNGEGEAVKRRPTEPEYFRKVYW